LFSSKVGEYERVEKSARIRNGRKRRKPVNRKDPAGNGGGGNAKMKTGLSD
jgi:hypothetical protein